MQHEVSDPSVPGQSAYARFVDRFSGQLIGLLAATIVIAGVGYSYHRGDELPYVDEQEYYAIANNVAAAGEFSTDGVRPNGHRAPLYPLLLAVVTTVGGDIPAMRIANFVLLAMSLYLVYRIGGEQGSPRTGVLAGTFVFGYVVLFYAAGLLFPQTLGGMLFVLFLYQLSRAESAWALAGAGVTFGLLILTIPMFLFSFLVIVGWLFLTRPHARLRSTAALVIPTGLVVSIWTVRNYLAFKAFVLVTTAAGATFLWGNSLESTIGSAEVDFLKRAYEETAHMDYVQADRYMLGKAFEQIKAHKLEFIGFYCLKVLNYFNFYNEHYASSESSWWKSAVMAVTYCPLLALLVLRLLWWKKLPPSRFEWLLVALYISAAFFYAIFHTRIRYRLPYDLVLISSVALFLGQWLWPARPPLGSAAGPHDAGPRDNDPRDDDPRDNESADDESRDDESADDPD